MAENVSFKSYIIIFLVAALFITAMYNFSSGINANYNKTLNVTNKQIDIENLQSNINTVDSDAQKWQNATLNEGIPVISQVLFIKSLWTTAKSMWVAMFNFYNIFTNAAYDLIGIPATAITVLTIILIIGLIFALYKTLKQGD